MEVDLGLPEDLEMALENDPLEIGSGTLATVYLVETAFHRLAIKKVTAGETANFRNEFVPQMTNELELLRRSQSEHIVDVFDLRFERPDAFLIMEFMDGRSLDTYLVDGGLSSHETQFLSEQLLSAVSHIHSLGIVHHRISPSNMLLSNGRQLLKLGGFSSATSGRGVHRVRFDASNKYYLHRDPQLFLADIQNPKFDIWTVGASMLHMRMGPSYMRSSQMDMLAHLEKDLLPPPLTYEPDGLGPFIARLMTIDTAKRPTASEALEGLKELKPLPLSKMAFMAAILSPYTRQDGIPRNMRILFTLNSLLLPKVMDSLRSIPPCPDTFAANEAIWDRMVATECLRKSIGLMSHVLASKTKEQNLVLFDKAIDALQKLDSQNISQDTKSSVKKWAYAIECVRSRVMCMNDIDLW